MTNNILIAQENTDGSYFVHAFGQMLPVTPDMKTATIYGKVYELQFIKKSVNAKGQGKKSVHPPKEGRVVQKHQK